MLIGLCGPAGAGKNTVAEMLVDDAGRPYRQVAFADTLYDCVSLVTGMTVEQLKNREIKEQPLPWLGKSPRQLLQTLGTEWGRLLVHEELWVRVTMEKLRGDLEAGRGVAITDVRFDNEAAAIIAAGGEVWRVVRPGWRCLAADAAKHQSEAGVSDHLIARTVDNSGTLDDLWRQLGTATI